MSRPEPLTGLAWMRSMAKRLDRLERLPNLSQDKNGALNSARLRLSATDDASLSSTAHAFQIGPTASNNLIVDPNEIMARNNGATSPLYIQTEGGLLGLGGPTSTVVVSGLLTNTLTDLATVNLNTVTTPGDYRQPLSASATSALNYPATIAGLLEVFSDTAGTSMIWQRYSGYGPYAGRVWQRGFYNGTWTAWARVGFPPATQALSWTASFVTYSGDSAPLLMRSGDTVFLAGTASPASNAVGTSISAIATANALTLPAGYRPARGVNVLCQGSSYDKFDMTISTAGTVAFGRYGPSTATSATWMPFSVSFLTGDPMPGSFV